MHARVFNGSITGYISYSQKVTAPDGTFYETLNGVSRSEKAACGLYEVINTTKGEQTQPYANYTKGERAAFVGSDTVTVTTTNVYPTLNTLKNRLVDELLEQAETEYPRVSLIVTPTEAALLVDEIREANRESQPSASNYPLIGDLVGRIEGVNNFSDAVSAATQFILNYKSNLASARRVLLDRRKGVLAAVTEREAIDARMGQ